MGEPGKSIKTILAPNLNVANGTETLEFYINAFGAKILYKLESEIDPGQIFVARLSINDAPEFWFSETSEHSAIIAENFGEKLLIRLLLTVADPDTLFAQALPTGAREIGSIHEEYGWRSGVVADPDWHLWEIARPLES